MCVLWPLRAFFTVFSTFSPYLTRVYPAKSLPYRFLRAFDRYTWKCFKMSFKFWIFFYLWGFALVGQKWSEKIFSHCYIDGAFFLVVQYPIGDLHAKFQLDGEFYLGIGKILTNSTGLFGKKNVTKDKGCS